MTRKLLALALTAWITPPAAAQDMPLSQILIDGEGWKKAEGKPEKPDPTSGMINGAPGVYVAESPDGATMFICSAQDTVVKAARKMRVTPTKSLLKSSPYCPLRLKRGEKSVAVGGLAVDRDGRIYAATEIGVQVFDPTGRMCGVLTPAAEGTATHLAFEGEQLTLWIGATKYTRKLSTSGVK